MSKIGMSFIKTWLYIMILHVIHIIPLSFAPPYFVNVRGKKEWNVPG